MGPHLPKTGSAWQHMLMATNLATSEVETGGNLSDSDARRSTYVATSGTKDSERTQAARRKLLADMSNRSEPEEMRLGDVWRNQRVMYGHREVRVLATHAPCPERRCASKNVGSSLGCVWSWNPLPW